MPLGSVPRSSIWAIDADAGVAAVDPGDEQELVLVAHGVDGGLGLVGLEGDGDDHAREHGARGQGQDG